MFEDHLLLRRASVQCFTNLCQSPEHVARCEGNNDKVKYLVLLCGDEDEEVAKAAGGALAMVTQARLRAQLISHRFAKLKILVL